MTLKRWGHVGFPLDALFLLSSSRTILRTPGRRAQDPDLLDGCDPFPGALEAVSSGHLVTNYAPLAQAPATRPRALT